MFSIRSLTGHCHRHSKADGPYSVLQYADDTLLLVRAEITDIRRLKVTLDNFALATSLKINYSKSTLVPIHVPPSCLQRIVCILQCQQASFPQVYSGLPLSNVKLNLTAFTPLISKVDRRLSGWQAALNH
jgi:mannosylglycoprotein endo-beta-mannosidase